MKTKFKILLFFIVCFNLAFSHNKIKLNPRKKYPVGITAHLLGPSGHLALSVNGFIVPKINIEAGSGIFNINATLTHQLFLGGKYHFAGNTWSKTTFYLGVYDAVDYNFKTHHLYFPLGINRIKKNHFTWSAEIAFQPDRAYYNSTFWGAIKIGYQFGFKIKKKKSPKSKNKK